MSEVTETKQLPALLVKMGEQYSIEPSTVVYTLKATCFSGVKDITDAQLVSLMVVADQYGLNPWTKEIYAFPSKNGGVVPVVGVDGWSRIINSNPQFDGMDFEYSTKTVKVGSGPRRCSEWVKCIIHRKDRAHPIEVTEFFDECYQAPKGNYDGPWQTHPRRFLRHKAVIQCSRLAFGFVGIYDQDEAERIVEGEQVRSARKGVMGAVLEESPLEVDEAKVAEYVEVLKTAVFDCDDYSIREMYAEMDNDTQIAVHGKLRSEDRSYIAQARAENQGEEIESVVE